MPIQTNDIYAKLKEAYSEANLNRITAGLLEMYRRREHGGLFELARRISSIVEVDTISFNKCFSQLVMLYHPDRGALHRREIDAIFAASGGKGLRRYSHILLVDDLGEIHSAPSATLADSTDEEYAWDLGAHDTGRVRDAEFDSFDDEQFAVTEEEFENTFFQALKMKYFGTLEVELPSYYLRDLDEIEMSGCGIVSLDGVEHCVQVKVIDISRNAITDISDLQRLSRVTELYASDNSIGYVDVVSRLVNLRIIDLSMNSIDDISPLFGLEHLEFVNLIGNPLPAAQIEKLKSLGCTVLH
jgi:hypothetical protein